MGSGADESTVLRNEGGLGFADDELNFWKNGCTVVCVGRGAATVRVFAWDWERIEWEGRLGSLASILRRGFDWDHVLAWGAGSNC